MIGQNRVIHASVFARRLTKKHIGKQLQIFYFQLEWAKSESGEGRGDSLQESGTDRFGRKGKV